MNIGKADRVRKLPRRQPTRIPAPDWPTRKKPINVPNWPKRETVPAEPKKGNQHVQ